MFSKYNKPMKEKALEQFISDLKKKQSDLRHKRNLLKEHKFFKEEDYVATKLSVIDEIIFNIEMLRDGREQNFKFNDF